MAEQTGVGRSTVSPNRTGTAAFSITASKKRTRYLNALIYGDYGVGKTYFAGTASEVPEMQDTLFANVESGDMTLEGMDLDLIGVHSYRQFARVFEFLRIHCRARDAGDLDTLRKLEAQLRNAGVEDPNEKIKPEDIEHPKQYKTIIIDSLTEVQKLAMYQLLGVVVGEHKLDVEPETPQFKEWGNSAEMIRLLVRSFRDLPMHTIFVAAQTVAEDERKRRFKTPALPGKLANEVQGFLDVVGYYIAAPNEAGVIQRRLYLEPGKTFQAKNRFPNFHDSYLDNPRMQDVFNLNKRAFA